MDAFFEQEEWPYGLVKFRQTMIGFIIGVFKQFQNKPMVIEDVVQLVTPYVPFMKRKEKGKKYQGNIRLIVQGSLQYDKLFIKDCHNFWRMNVSYIFHN